MLPYLLYIATLAGIYLIIALAYAIPVGYTGLLQLGHVSLVAIGAYTAATMTTHGISFWIALPAAAALAGLAGFFLGLPTQRVGGDAFALLTLGFVFVTNAVLINWTSVTRGPFGISGILRPHGFESPIAFFVLVLAILGAVAFSIMRIVHSPFGRALEAVRDDALAAEALGKPTYKLKLIALTISGSLAGIAGALLAPFLQFINPQLFWLDLAVWILAALVVGGLATIKGAVLGMLVLFLLFEPLRFLSLPSDVVGPLRLIMFSLLLLVVILVRPKGIWGKAQLE